MKLKKIIGPGLVALTAIGATFATLSSVGAFASAHNVDGPVWVHYQGRVPTASKYGVRECWCSCNGHSYQFTPPTGVDPSTIINMDNDAEYPYYKGGQTYEPLPSSDGRIISTETAKSLYTFTGEEASSTTAKTIYDTVSMRSINGDAAVGGAVHYLTSKTNTSNSNLIGGDAVGAGYVEIPNPATNAIATKCFDTGDLTKGNCTIQEYFYADVAQSSTKLVIGLATTLNGHTFNDVFDVYIDDKKVTPASNPELVPYGPHTFFGVDCGSFPIPKKVGATQYPRVKLVRKQLDSKADGKKVYVGYISANNWNPGSGATKYYDNRCSKIHDYSAATATGIFDGQAVHQLVDPAYFKAVGSGRVHEYTPGEGTGKDPYAPAPYYAVDCLADAGRGVSFKISASKATKALVELDIVDSGYTITKASDYRYNFHEYYDIRKSGSSTSALDTNTCKTWCLNSSEPAWYWTGYYKVFFGVISIPSSSNGTVFEFDRIKGPSDNPHGLNFKGISLYCIDSDANIAFKTNS